MLKYAHIKFELVDWFYAMLTLKLFNAGFKVSLLYKQSYGLKWLIMI